MRPAFIGTLGLALGVALGAAGCAGGQEVESADQHVDLTLSSTAFTDGQAIPIVYTCDGPGLRVPLTWSVHGEKVTALALFVQDVDADVGGGFYVHWLVLDLPPTSTGVADHGKLPKGAVTAANTQGSADWVPPCPPAGDGPHHYEFTLYALEQATDLPAGVDAAMGQAEILKRTLATRSIVGTVTR